MVKENPFANFQNQKILKICYPVFKNQKTGFFYMMHQIIVENAHFYRRLEKIS
ncbi:hypothetical protein HMPREF1984_01794 [Leptotrichia sp. oral taxon 215 str. W9775]|nr:hypothetical protein HMPREF1984_01794 [Leptotrichia sp. oral taxon 215 str. W9775]